MNPLLTLFEPVITALLDLLAQAGTSLAPEATAAAKDFISTGFDVAVGYGTLQLNTSEATDSFKILVNTIEADGNELLGLIEIDSEKIPDTISTALVDSIGALPGELLKLIP